MITLDWLAADVFLKEGDVEVVITHCTPAVGIQFAKPPTNGRQARAEEEISLTLLTNRKPLDYDIAIGVYFVKIFLRLIGQDGRPMLPIGRSNLQILCCNV